VGRTKGKAAMETDDGKKVEGTAGRERAVAAEERRIVGHGSSCPCTSMSTGAPERDEQQNTQREAQDCRRCEKWRDSVLKTSEKNNSSKLLDRADGEEQARLCAS
jgi:hypothetical protein